MKREQRKLTFSRREGPRVGDWGRVLVGAAPIGGIARVLTVDKSDGVVLVEFLESDEELHDGNVGPVRGKDHHCWWITRDNITPIIEQASVLRDGRETLALVGAAVGRATCCEGEEFDPLTGAIIALARAYGVNPTAAAMRVLEVLSAVKKDEPKLRIVDKYGMDYGRVGDPTPYKDANGVELRVGDVVRLKNLKSGRVYPPRWVVATKELGPFVMGIQVACDPRTGKIREWEVSLNSPYKEREAGEEADDGVLSIRSPEGLDSGKKSKDRNKKEVIK